MEFHLETVDVQTALAAAADFVRPLAEQHGVRIVQAAARPPLPVRADRGRLDQVLFNLLSNGVKYNRQGGRLRLACRRPDARTVRIIVADTGPGMAPGDIGRLFTPFQRLNAAERGISGTGIGLTISRSLAAAMGGRIRVVSRPGKGSIFFLDLPAVSGLAAPGGETAAARPPARTILLIDDQSTNFSLIERVLDGRPDLRLLNATDARSGIGLAREHRPRPDPARSPSARPARRGSSAPTRYRTPHPVDSRHRAQRRRQPCAGQAVAGPGRAGLSGQTLQGAGPAWRH